jgi:multiple antibiotic resistance protein
MKSIDINLWVSLKNGLKNYKEICECIPNLHYSKLNKFPIHTTIKFFEVKYGMINEILKSFITLLIIIDPFVSAVFFIGQFKKSSVAERNKAVWTAILVAGGLLFLFLFTGLFLLKVLGVSFNGLMVGGGIILLIMGVTTVLGIEFVGHHERVSSAAILIGTPLLSGPGALTTIIILSKDYGMLIPAIAAALVLLTSFIILKFAYRVEKVLGTEIIEIFSKILGLLLAALAVDFIYSGIKGFILGG